jgi:hypothetical protein
VPTSIFLSYTRRDVGIVRKLQLMVRASGAVPWRDEDGIQPGEQWRVSIASAIERSDRVLVFWCRHASRSQEVRREYRLALTLGKLVIPVRLDRTPASTELAGLQATDVSGLVRWNHAVLVVERWMWVVGLLALAAVGIRYAAL